MHLEKLWIINPQHIGKYSPLCHTLRPVLAVMETNRPFLQKIERNIYVKNKREKQYINLFDQGGSSLSRGNACRLLHAIISSETKYFIKYLFLAVTSSKTP